MTLNQSLFISFAIMLAGCHVDGSAAEYYVDFSQGSDNFQGTTPQSPWKHAPGDPNAQGVAAKATLRPGDTIHFKAGVSYRGQVNVKFDGLPDKPITFSGRGFGDGMAIIEGADPVISVVSCQSKSTCYGAKNWQKLSIVTFSPPATSFIKLYDESGGLSEAQIPAAADQFFAEDISGANVSRLRDKALIESGRLPSPLLARALAGTHGGTLLIWVYGNLVVRRDITGVDGDMILFNPGDLKLYPDRDGRYALRGTVNAITAPNQYAVVSPTRAVAWLSGTGAVQVGSGRGGFDLDGRSNIVIRDFVFQHQTASDKGRAEGGAIFRRGAAGSGLIIDSNRFEHSALLDGKGVVTLRGISNVTVSNNVFSFIEIGSGVRAAGSNTGSIKIVGNVIDHVGRTGIAFLGVSDGEISGNVITNLRGVHGNGISLYLTNRRVSVTNNRVESTNTPMTFHGDRTVKLPGNHDFIIRRNIFLATDAARAAITSWGAGTRNVTIQQNVLSAPRAGFLGNGTDTGVIVTGNYTSGILVPAGPKAGWTISNNSVAPATLRKFPTNPMENQKFCRAVSVPQGEKLGGIAC